MSYTSCSHTGAAAELFVSQYLMMKGALVFRNCSPHGPVDLIATYGEATVKIDVKSQTTRRYRKDGIEQFSCGPIGLRDDGVWTILYVHGERCPMLPVGFLEALGIEQPDAT